MVVLLLSEQSGGGAEQNWPNGRQRVKTGSCKVVISEQTILMFTKMVSPKVHKFMPIMWLSYGRTPTWEVGGPELAKGRNRGGRDGMGEDR